jgi:hypothetical protein
MLTQTDRAILGVQIAAERDDPGFTLRAGDVIVRLLRNYYCSGMPGETLVEMARLLGCRPKDDRAFGPVFQSLVRRGLIRQVGWCERRKGHGSPGGRIWALTERA